MICAEIRADNRAAKFASPRLTAWVRARRNPHMIEPGPDWVIDSIYAARQRQQQPSVISDQATEPRFLVDWVDQHRETDRPADPNYPDGCAIDVAMDAPHACRLELPCPAARCGLWVVTCRACGFAITLATTGRSDDPRSLRVPCRPV